MYRDKRLAGFDAAAVVEVVEHLDEPRLAAFERVLFEFAKPATVVLTTPNVEYNVRFETLPAGSSDTRTIGSNGPGRSFREWAESNRGRSTATQCDSCRSPGRCNRRRANANGPF
jgi:hypothetical protein